MAETRIICGTEATIFGVSAWEAKSWWSVLGSDSYMISGSAARSASSSGRSSCAKRCSGVEDHLHFGLFSIGLGLTYGPQAALYFELFPPSVRFSGVSISYAIGAIVGGAFAPTIAQSLAQATGGTTAVVVYLLVVVAISVTAVSLIRDRAGIDLSFRNQAEQKVGELITDKRTVESVKTVQEV